MSVAKKNDSDDFAAKTLPYLNDLFCTAIRLGQNQAGVEELMLEVYRQARKSFHTLDSNANCRAWMFRILFDKTTRSRREFSKSMEKSNDDALKSIRESTATARQLCDTEVLSAFGKLPLVYGEALLLADVQEFSNEEIAFILKIPAASVESHVSLGRKLLRMELNQSVELAEIENEG